MTAHEESPATQASAPRRSPRTRTIALVIYGRIAPGDVPGLCERLGVLLGFSDANDVVCDVGGLVDPDAVTVDALARLQLTARRLGRHIRLRHASYALRELLALVGLCDVVPPSAESGLWPGRQTEERKEGGGIEE